MAIVCRAHQILFIMTPITACSAVGKALREELGGEFLPAEPITDGRGRVRLDSKHNTLADLLRHELLDESASRKMYKFSTVRNPFDRLVSKYAKEKNKLQEHLGDPGSWIHRDPRLVEDIVFCRDHSFDEWIERRYRTRLWPRLRGQGRKNGLLRYAEGMDTVMRYENLDGDFAKVLKAAGVARRVEIPRFHVTEGRTRDYRSYYSASSRKIVEYAFRDVLERFGYGF
jgi:hypothetical protein